MKKYEYVTVEYNVKELRESLTVKHREIIDLYASKGYRYAGMIPIELGNPTHLSLIHIWVQGGYSLSEEREYPP